MANSIRRVKRLLPALALVAAFAAIFTPTASADGAWGSNGCGTSEKRPSLIAFTCGDGSVVFETAEWSRWFLNEAVGSGYLKHPNTEDPSCAGRPISACPVVESPATVRFSRSSYCPSNSRWQFLRLHLEAPEDVDPELREVTRDFKCSEFGGFRPPTSPEKSGPYWRDCGRPHAYAFETVLAHMVPCGKARRVIRKFWSIVYRGPVFGPVRIKGLSCTQKGGKRPISCKRGQHKVRGSYPSRFDIGAFG